MVVDFGSVGGVFPAAGRVLLHRRLDGQGLGRRQQRLTANHVHRVLFRHAAKPDLGRILRGGGGRRRRKAEEEGGEREEEGGERKAEKAQRGRWRRGNGGGKVEGEGGEGKAEEERWRTV